jgi:hypothetical protein
MPVQSPVFLGDGLAARTRRGARSSPRAGLTRRRAELSRCICTGLRRSDSGRAKPAERLAMESTKDCLELALAAWKRSRGTTMKAIIRPSPAGRRLLAFPRAPESRRLTRPRQARPNHFGGSAALPPAPFELSISRLSALRSLRAIPRLTREWARRLVCAAAAGGQRAMRDPW